MKKIIYSLVIMIAAGSLFTSCVENTEPQGIRDLREAKADYLASLSKLREADAELVKAQAAYQSAQIAVVEADAALKQALANIAQALADAAQIGVEYLDAELQMKLEADKAAAEIAALEAQENLAKQQAQLETALRKIAAESIGLTKEEKLAITEKTVALNGAYDTYNAWLDAYNGAEKELWYAEYNVAAGKEGYETADSYRDSIADLQAQIVDLQANIASYEALKAEPAGIKDTLDAIAEEITALDAEITTKGDVRKLYEASLPFVDAKKEFKERVKTFKEDSLKDAEFIFADEKEGNYYYKEYPLTDGKHLDSKFTQYLNNKFYVVDFDPEQEMGKSAKDYGYFGRKGVIYVGGLDEEGKEDLEKAIVLVDEIVEGLNRELVVIDNITDSSDIETLKKKAEAAKKAYETDRDTISKGLSKYQPYIDSVKKVATLAQDTVNAKATYAEADSIAKLALKDKNTKDAAQIVEVRKAEANYKTAVKALVSAVDDYALRKDASRLTANDSTKFVTAINTFGTAQAAFLGYQDSLVCQKGYDPETGDPKQYKEALSEISLANFKEGKDGKKAYGDTTFLEVLKIISQNKIGDVWKATESVWIASVKNILTGKTTVEDSIVVAKNIAAVKDAIAAFETSKKVSHEKDSIANALETKFHASKERFNNYDGDDVAKADYLKVVSRFWARTAAEKDTAAYDFPWTDKTFFEPENCVVFDLDDEKIIPNNELVIALNGVDVENPDDIAYSVLDVEGKKNVNDSKIFFGTNGKTEFAKALFTAQIAEEAGEYVPNKARLEKINSQVAKIKEDVEAAIAEYEAATEGQEEILARLCGVGEDGNPLFTINQLSLLGLKEDFVDKAEGKWAFGGYLLEWAEELAPEYPAIVKDAEEAVRPLKHRKANLAKFKRTLDRVYTAWWNEFEKDGKLDQRNVAAIVKHFETQIDDLNDQIDVLNGDIARYEEIIDACEAGYSPAEAKVAPLKKKVEAYKKYLEQAEEALARAQKEYDEVIAKYGVRDAE